ncbi:MULTISPECIES: hypothetical protein [Aeromonas]|uniref:hypothetical protein n=1 Tax=Aeromonas TaxID=642 RepID=UPI0005A8D461|nr:MULTISPECIES: hypothetical protein [Aeromonas]
MSGGKSLLSGFIGQLFFLLLRLQQLLLQRLSALAICPVLRIKLHRLLETLLLRPIGLSHLGVAPGCCCALYREDSVHDSLHPDLLAELFLFLLFVVVTQGLQ